MTEARGRSGLQIAVDGGAATGKTSTSMQVAQRLGLAHISTGLVYRALAWVIVRDGLDPDDSVDCLKVAHSLAEGDFEFTDADRVRIGDVLLERDQLRGPAVTDGSSRVAVHAGARQVLLDLQRQAAAGGAVVEGRDIGTVVLPNADLKIFLIVSDVEHRRRSIKSGGIELAQTNLERDRRETTRTAAPLVAAEGAWIIDTSNRTVAKVADIIVGYAVALGYSPVA